MLSIKCLLLGVRVLSATAGAQPAYANGGLPDMPACDFKPQPYKVQLSNNHTKSYVVKYKFSH